MKRILGVVALLFGVTILLWVSYNLLIEMQPAAEGRNPWWPIVISVLMIYVGIMWLRGKTPG